MKLKSVYAGSVMAAALLIAACNKNDDENTTVDTVSTQDSTFLVQASQSNWGEINLGTLALTNASNDSVRKFAQMMITDHTTAQADLTSVVNNITTNANINDSLSAEIVAMRDSLKTLSGTAFDSAYIAGQVRSHQKTLDAFNTEIASGQNSRVKAYANDKQPAIQNHLNLADSIYARFNP
jgi:putative membrane protein